MSFIPLSTGKLYNKKEKRKLKNFPAGYVGRFYRNFADNVDNFLGSDFYGQITNDVQRQNYVTKDRINSASF